MLLIMTGFVRGNLTRGRRARAIGAEPRAETKSLPTRVVWLILQGFRGQQSHPHGKTNDIAARAKSELLTKTSAVRLDGFHADGNLPGYLRAGVTPCHESQHLQFTIAEDVYRPCGTSFCAFLRQHVLHKNVCQTRVHEDPSAMHGVYSGNQL